MHLDALSRAPRSSEIGRFCNFSKIVLLINKIDIIDCLGSGPLYWHTGNVDGDLSRSTKQVLSLI